MTKRKVGWQKKNASDEVQVLPEDDAEYTYIDDCPSINAESSNSTKKKTLVAVHVPCHSDAIVCTKQASVYESLTGDRSTDGEYASKLEITEARKQTSKNTFDAVHVPCHSDAIVCTEQASAYESLTSDRSTDGEYASKLEIHEASYQWVTVDEDAKPNEDEIEPDGSADVTAGDMYLTVVDND
ncbi:uncharacterized protein LOC127867931 [Dreissena polymorpha]|uniref:uncharacterized protein LOC127867931 n=1 Tax=Dreissena polymorpha TaxID=45954 RepID=UPI002263BA33|nr:uncharacterized protein LOC127867931 [Dreissena polymorpha]